MESAQLTIRPVTAAEVRPLRSLVLRRGAPPETLVYEGDDHPLALHVGAFLDDDLVGIASIYTESPPPGLEDEIPPRAYDPGASFRLRGMATHPAARGRGVGTGVLHRCFEHARCAGASYMWCNARTTAMDFYLRLGFSAVGDEFTMPEFGRHYVMWRAV